MCHITVVTLTSVLPIDSSAAVWVIVFIFFRVEWSRSWFNGVASEALKSSTLSGETVIIACLCRLLEPVQFPGLQSYLRTKYISKRENDPNQHVCSLLVIMRSRWCQYFYLGCIQDTLWCDCTLCSGRKCPEICTFPVDVAYYHLSNVTDTCWRGIMAASDSCIKDRRVW